MDNNTMNGTVGLHLNKLNGVSVVDVRGTKCVVIPVDSNGIYISDKGTIVLSYFMSKMPEEKWGKSHTLKRKLTKDEYKSLSKDQRDNTPIAGYFEPWRPRDGSYNNSNNGYQQQNYGAIPTPPPASPAFGGGSVDDLSDMPF